MPPTERRAAVELSIRSKPQPIDGQDQAGPGDAISAIKSGNGPGHTISSTSATEGLTGMVHPINSGIGGFFSGMMLGVYTKNPTVMMGASAGLALAGVIGDVNGRAFLLNPERFYSKAHGLRKPGEGAQLAD